MSKAISLHSLTTLRQKIKEEGENYFIKNKFKDNSFDSENVEFISATDYPELDEGFMDQFNRTFQENPKNEFLLAKLLHENIKINRRLAANNLYWVYLNLNYFFNYIKNRWLKSKSGEELGENEIDRYFLALEPSHNSLIKSPIAGLWWAIELTIDESLEDKYHYSKIFLSDRNLRDKNLGTYQLIRYKNVLQASLDFYATYKDATKEEKRIGSEAIAQQMSKTINQIGGLTLLGYLSKKEIFEILYDNKELIFERAYKIKKGKVISRQKISDNQRELWDEENEESEKSNGNYYFTLDKSTGSYKIGSKPDNSFDENVQFNIDNDKCFLVHVYQEGKIKKTNLKHLELKIKKGNYDNDRLFKNGFNNKLTLNTITQIDRDSLFCVAYQDDKNKYVKILDAQDKNIFRADNFNLRQEGKKIVYSKTIKNLYFKAIPINFKDELQRLIYTPIARGAIFNNPYYDKEWSILKKLWPELLISFKIKDR